MVIPFGKHKGKPVEDVPSDYIRWLLENGERLSTALIIELENQLTLREGKGVMRSAPRS